MPDYRNSNYISHCLRLVIAHSSKAVICLPCGHPTAEPPPLRIKRVDGIGRCVLENILGGDYDEDVVFSTLGLPSAAKQLFFQVSASLHARSHSCFSFSLLVVSSAMACSVSSFSNVHFSIFCASFSFNCWMYCTARCRIEPLFFSHPGTILANSLIPSLMVSRRRRSTELVISNVQTVFMHNKSYLLYGYLSALCATRPFPQLALVRVWVPEPALRAHDVPYFRLLVVRSSAAVGLEVLEGK